MRRVGTYHKIMVKIFYRRRQHRHGGLCSLLVERLQATLPELNAQVKELRLNIHVTGVRIGTL